MPIELSCPDGHSGPWRFVEAIEVWRDVMAAGPDGLVVSSQWHTGEGYDDGVEGSAYLLCWADLGGSRCAESVELPEDIPIEWD